MCLHVYADPLAVFDDSADRKKRNREVEMGGTCFCASYSDRNNILRDIEFDNVGYRALICRIRQKRAKYRKYL